MKALLFLLAVADPLAGQSFTQRGYLETRGVFFPYTVPGDSSHAIGDALLRWEAFYRITSNWRLAGALDARADTHHQVERTLRLDWQDRSAQRPAFSLRRLSVSYSRAGLTAEFGKQFIRWGKADILNPTDRFAPKDFLEVIDYDFLGVLAARATYEQGSNTIELVFTPRMTPSRTPLPGQRWVNVPEASVPIADRGGIFPGGGQFGARFNHVGSGFEASACFFEGFNYLPTLDLQNSTQTLAVNVTRVYPKLRLYGADAAVPLRWFTVKGEAAWFTSSDLRADEFVLYVIQIERQQGEWSLVGGYAGEAVTAQRNPYFFAPDRGIAKTFLGRAAYTIDPTRSVAFEAAVRHGGEGAYVKGEYSQAIGRHWRATAGFVLLAGKQSDFLGQYQRNSHAVLAVRYSF